MIVNNYYLGILLNWINLFFFLTRVSTFFQLEAAENKIYVDVGMILKLHLMLVGYSQLVSDFLLNIYRFLGRLDPWKCTKYQYSWRSLRCWCSWCKGNHFNVENLWILEFLGSDSCTNINQIAFLFLKPFWLFFCVLLVAVFYVPFRNQWLSDDHYWTYQGTIIFTFLCMPSYIFYFIFILT